MKVLLASSEVFPYSKTGGLADMVGALAKSLAAAGDEVGVVTPLYRGIRERYPGLQALDWRLELPLGNMARQARLWTFEPHAGESIYFVDQPEFFDRAGIYQENGEGYADNAARFIFFSKCVAHLARSLHWRPQLIHVHDWHTSLVPMFMRHEVLREGQGNPLPTCLTIHNLAYQGVFSRAAYELTNLPADHFNVQGVEFYGKMNCLKAGIRFAEAITTVSPRYAREILTEEFGCGLDGLLREREAQLCGILNGVDYEEWNTTRNPHLADPFDLGDLSGKTNAKRSLQREMNLPTAPRVPLFAAITRLTEQKGVDILLVALEELLAADIQFVLLGSGSHEYARAFLGLAQRHPSKVSIRVGFDEALSHRIEAAADFFLMPSRFEPCGLNQMYSQRYGTIPIVRKTGGLDDTVIDINEDPSRATGIKFGDYSTRALAKAMRKALVLFGQPDLLRHFQNNAMQSDFSWDRTREEYRRVYRHLLRYAEGDG